MFPRATTHKSNPQSIKHPLIEAIDSSYSVEDFRANISNINLENNTINNNLNCGYYIDTSDGRRLYTELPLFYAVSRGKAYLISCLKDLGAREPSDRSLLNYAASLNSAIADIQGIYDAGFKKFYASIFDSKNVAIFHFIHEKVFGCSLLAMARGEDLSSEAIGNYKADLISGDYRKRAKPGFINAIRESLDLKSALKMQCLLGLENPIITFLKSSKERNQIKATRSYKALMKILGQHQFQLADFEYWRERLLKNINDDEFKPNPALAALYFSCVNADEQDYQIFQKHLLITAASGFTPKMQETLNHLLSRDGLSRSELSNLKKNVSTILNFQKDTYKDFIEKITDVSHSPLRSIARTIKSTRAEKETKTYRALRGMGLFLHQFSSGEAGAAYQGPKVIANTNNQ